MVLDRAVCVKLRLCASELDVPCILRTCVSFRSAVLLLGKVKAGADKDAVDDNGLTPLRNAKNKRHHQPPQPTPF